jgi:hypothetical protein
VIKDWAVGCCVRVVGVGVSPAAGSYWLLATHWICPCSCAAIQLLSYTTSYCWIGHKPGSGLSDRPRGALRVFASSDRL